MPGQPASGVAAFCSADLQIGVMALLGGTDAHLEVGATIRTGLTPDSTSVAASGHRPSDTATATGTETETVAATDMDTGDAILSQ